jgi:transcriptional regulator with XRE-family HTH domain
MRLTDYLSTSGVSDADFAEAIRVSRQAVHRYKHGRRPKWSVLDRIREVTGGAVTADDFLQDDAIAGAHAEAAA